MMNGQIEKISKKTRIRNELRKIILWGKTVIDNTGALIREEAVFNLDTLIIKVEDMIAIEKKEAISGQLLNKLEKRNIKSRQKIIEMLSKGMSYDQIERKLGVSSATISKLSKYRNK